MQPRNTQRKRLIQRVAPRPATSGRATYPEARHLEDESANDINSVIEDELKKGKQHEGKQQYDYIIHIIL